MPNSHWKGRRAGALGFVWLLGLHLLPLAHNLDHRPDHTHGPGDPARAFGDPTFALHAHGDGPPHTHAVEAAEAPQVTSLPAPTGTDPDHGRGSILHFAAAAFESEAIEVLAPGTALCRPSPAPAPIAFFLRASLLPARGPPPLLA